MENQKTVPLSDLMEYLKKKLEESGAAKEANKGRLSPEKEEIADAFLDLYLFCKKLADK